MKQVKVAFLFFYLFTFLSCKNDALKIDKEIQSKSIVQTLFDSELYQKSNYSNRLVLSKKIINDSILNESENYLMLNNLSFLHAKLHNIDSAIFFTKKMLAKNKVSGIAYYKLGNYFFFKDLKDSAFYYYKKSKEIYLKENDSIKLGECYRNIAIIESDFGDYANSDISGITALKYFNGKKHKSIISVYNCLAINSKKQALYEQALYNFNKSLFFKLTTKQSIGINNNIANVYKEQKQYVKAISVLKKLLKETISNPKTKARIIDNLAHCIWLDNPKAIVLKDFITAKSIRKKAKDTYGLIASYSHLSDFYYDVDKDKSLVYANKMYQVAKKENSTQDIIEAISKIVKLETDKKSIVFYRKGISLRDSLLQVRTLRQYKFAKIKYNYKEEAAEKIKFKNLATENELIAQKENNQKKNILILGIIITAVLLFFSYKRKQEHKKKILQETYHTETRIAKRLHDELGNDLFNTLTKIQNSDFNKEDIISDLDKIYLQTRTISHENDTIEVGDKFELYFKNLIASYNSDSCKIILKGLSMVSLNTLTIEKQIVIYRVFNELLVNMKKHSKANLVVLSFNDKANYLEMMYADNGIGFKNGTIILKNGLRNMENRIKSIKGTINFEQQVHKGFKVTICLKK